MSIKEKAKNMNAAEKAAKKAATEKRLASMRANLEKLEKRAGAILAKGDSMTDVDRLELLNIVNVAYHDSGKIEGIYSIDSTASCAFCARMIQAAIDNILMICGACYAAADAWKEAAWRRHKLNARILSSVLFTIDERRALVGQRVYLAETGHRGRPLVRCSAVIQDVLVIRSRKGWNQARALHRVPRGSTYDWHPWTKVKYLYTLSDIQTVDPFTAPEGFRHGRVYMTYD